MARELILIPKEKFEEMMKNCSNGKTIIEDDKNKPSKSEYSEEKTMYSSVKPDKWIQKSTENTTTQTGDGNESYVKMTPMNFLTQKDKSAFKGIRKEKKQRKSTVNEKINWETPIKEKDKNIKTKWLSFKI